MSRNAAAVLVDGTSLIVWRWPAGVDTRAGRSFLELTSVRSTGGSPLGVSRDIDGAGEFPCATAAELRLFRLPSLERVP